MKINQNGVSQTASTPPAPLSAASSAARDPAIDTSTTDGDAYTPSAELVRLLDLVKQEPDVRSDRVREVAERLQQGNYLTPESAAATADAMLRSLD